MEADITPVHLGIILDGNRRWAKSNRLAKIEGHKRGYENLKDISTYALNRGVKYLSAYMFSTENWDRSLKEINYLMNLAHRMLTHDLEDMNKENIKIVWLGSPDRLSKKLVSALRRAEELTKNNTKGTLCVCFNYGGKQEIVDSVKSIISKGIKPDDIIDGTVSDNLYASDIPPIDLVVRTSGEQRLSGFMLWRAAYAELFFVDKAWPDFDKNDLDAAISEYSRRNRRFGK